MQAEIAILTVIPEELRRALNAFNIRFIKDCRKAENGTNYWHGSVRSQIVNRNYSVVVTCIGHAGNYDCTAATSDVINEYEPKVVLLMGIAAGLRDRVKIGEVVLSERVVAYETAAIDTDEEGKERMVSRPDMPRIEYTIEQDVARYEASLGLNRVERKFRSKTLGGTYPAPSEGKEEEYQNHVATEASIRTTTIASGEKLLRNPSVLYRLRWHMHGRIEVGEMEAAGLQTACRHHQLPWLVIRGISDFGDELKDDRFHEFAAKMAAAATYDFVVRGLDLGTRPSIYPQAYDDASGHILSRERLSKKDFEEGRAIKPPQAEGAFRALRAGKSIAVQGPPGSGKSAFGAWINWMATANGQLTAAFSGRELQQGDVASACKGLEDVPPDHILLIDDIHLAEPVLARVKSLPWSSERRFLLLGRAPYVKQALIKGQLPRIEQGLIDITVQDSEAISETLARQYLDEDAAAQVLHHTGKDLVLTKWVL